MALFPFFGWGGYAADGLLITCGYDFISQVYISTLHIPALDSDKKKRGRLLNKFPFFLSGLEQTVLHPFRLLLQLYVPSLLDRLLLLQGKEVLFTLFLIMSFFSFIQNYEITTNTSSGTPR